MAFSIITDSTSDLSSELREKYGIDYCKMEFSEGDRNYHASLDWDEISSLRLSTRSSESTLKGVMTSFTSLVLRACQDRSTPQRS